MKSLELWNNLKEIYEISSFDDADFIFPTKEIRIKNKGIIKFLKKEEEKVTIECVETKKLLATIDHIFTDISGNDIRADELSLGNKIFGKNDLSEFSITQIKKFNMKDFSYDVETSSHHFMANDLYSHNCRSWLSPLWEEVEYPLNEKFYWVYNTDNKIDYPYGTFVNKASFEEVPEGKYKKGKYAINFRGNTGWLIERKENTVTILQPKVYGRFNEGVITLNLPHCAGEATLAYRENQETPLIDLFYKILDERLELCRRGLKIRDEYVRKIKAKNSPILWMHGALYRTDNPEKTVGELIDEHPGRPSISLGFAGLYETCEFLIGQSNTTKEGMKLCKQILTYINKRLDEWKVEDHLNYSLYGTPEEALTGKLANANRRDFGLIEKITDKDYVVNSYHVDPREKITAWEKLRIEGQYLYLSKGGAVSYVETGDLTKNPKVVVKIIQFMHEHIAYAEVNTTMGVCYSCGNKGFFPLTKNEKGVFNFHCPKCGEYRDEYLRVKGRVCGYLGELSAGNTGKGRLDDYYHRTQNLDFDYIADVMGTNYANEIVNLLSKETA